MIICPFCGEEVNTDALECDMDRIIRHLFAREMLEFLEKHGNKIQVESFLSLYKKELDN